MTDTPLSLIGKIAEVAEALQDPRTSDLVDAVRRHGSASKLQILVVGLTGSGRSSIVDAMLESSDLLPRSPFPKAPIGITVRYGSSKAAEIVAVDGGRTAISPEKLSSWMTNPQTSSRHYRGVTVEAPCEMLKTCDVKIEPLEAAYAAGDWRSLLAGIDFIVLVLNANALLSHHERQFVRQYLADGFGLYRVAVVVNQMDLVPPEERDSILDLVRTFLGPFESQPALIEMSADAANANPQGDDATAIRTLTRDLLDRYEPLRSTALRQSLESVLAELADGVAREQALLSMTEGDVREMRDSIASRRDRLQQRIERTQRHVDTFVGSVIKEQLLREIEGFSEVFRRRLPDEIMAIPDVERIKRHLPGYIETVWKEFLNGQLIAVRSKLSDEIQSLDRMIEADLGDLLGDRATALSDVLRDFDPSSEAMRTFVMPKRGKHRAETIARGLSLHGYVMLFFDPPAGAIALAASHGIRRIYKVAIDAADKRAIVASATTAGRDLQREIQDRVAEQFATLVEQLKEDVADAYRAGIARIEEFLADSAVSKRDVQGRAAALAALERETIPRLRLLLQQLDWPDVA